MSRLLGALRGAKGAHFTPVAYRKEDGLMIGHNGDAWLWRVLDQVPLHWEDRPARAQVASKLSDLLADLGRSSRDGIIPGSKVGAFSREFHMLTLWWDEQMRMPEETPPMQMEWLDAIFDQFYTYNSLTAVGVKLRRSVVSQSMSITKFLQQTIKDAVGGEPNPMIYTADRARLSGMLGRAGGRIPTDEEMLRLELWWNGGNDIATKLVPAPDGQSVGSDSWPNGLEISALYDYEEVVLDPERGMWAAEAFGHPEGCVALSIKGEMASPKAARDKMRSTRRKAEGRLSEQQATGDLDREEDHQFVELSESLEQMFALGGEPMIRDASIIFARSVKPTSAFSDFKDHLESAWGLKTKVMDERQIPTLEEMLPCSVNTLGKTKPFRQAATVGFVAESGMSAFARIGDKSGVWIGLSIPNMHGVWLDPAGSSKENKPPAMAVLGEPGAGKTFLLQLIATQAALSGTPTVMINPKPADSLDGFCKAIGGEVVKISAMEKETGMLDPFRYAPPEIAADIAMSHITSVLTDIPQQEEVMMERAIRRAAVSGAKCVGDMLKHPEMPELARDLVLAQKESNNMFALGISDRERPPLGLSETGGLTLIEFDRPIDLPAGIAPMSSYPRKTRIDAAVVRLVIRSSLEQMFSAGGGVMILDEAHVLMGSKEGQAILQRMGREGRSQQILPILATQRIADVMAQGVDMTSYLGRSLIMKMADPVEADAALGLIGLEPTQARRDWLAEASPIRGGRGALALHRDLEGRCSAMLIGKIPEHVAQLFSTNPLDRQARVLESEQP